MKTIQLVLAGIYIILHFIISMILGVIPAKLLMLLGMRRASERLLRFNGYLLSKGIVTSLGGRVTVIGKENIPLDERRICFVSNHQSYADIPLLVSYIPILAGFVAKQELTRIPILNSWMKALGCVFIDRSSARSSIKAIFDGVASIKAGHPLFIFPEGTRSKSKEFGEFKAGSLKLATRAKAIIIPITIDGTYTLIEKRRGSRLLNRITLTIHPPIDSALIDEQGLKALPQEVYSVITDSDVSSKG